MGLSIPLLSHSLQCLLYIRVENEGKKIYGQNCFPVSSLLPGIKFIPVRTNGGELIPESGVFVRIKKSKGVSLNHMANLKSQPAGQASLKREEEELAVKVENPAEKVENPAEKVEEVAEEELMEMETVEEEVYISDSDPELTYI